MGLYFPPYAMLLIIDWEEGIPWFVSSGSPNKSKARARTRSKDRVRTRAKGLGLAVASEADFEFLPSTFSIAVDTSGGRLCCLLELRITLILSLAQRSYRQSILNH